MNLLTDKRNLKILKEICKGSDLSVNLTYLSRQLKKHRNTIKARVEELFNNNIMNPPVFPFYGQFSEHPLLILVLADLPHDAHTKAWIKNDKYIFTAFKVRHGQYNTLLVIFHKDILGYHLWRENLVRKGKIPPRDVRIPSDAHFYSNQLVVKYDPNEGMRLLKEHFDKKNISSLNGFQITRLHMKIMELLLGGKGIRINETALSERLGMNKKTLRRRIDAMRSANLILDPVCRFPSFFVPPGFVLQVTKIEINKNKEEVLKFLKKDPHIPLAYNICEGRFNYLLFEIFFKAEESVEWSSHLREKFRDSITLTDSIVLMENNAFDIDQQKVSLGVIKEKIKMLY